MYHSYKFQTERLMFLPLLSDDLEIIRLWRNQDHIRVNFINPNIINSEQQKQWYENYLRNDNDIMFMTLEKNSNTPIGSVGIYNINKDNKSAEFGRLIIGNNQNSGKGYGSEIVAGVCDFARKEFELMSIYLQVLADNKVAKHIYNKNGFYYTGTTTVNGLELIQMKLNFEF